MASAPQLARQIVSAAPWASSAVAGPDHPYLLTAPDALLADEFGLLAVFVEHAAEARRPEALATRQILCTLALPSHTRFALVARGDRTVPERDWDLVVSAGQPRYIADALRSVERTRSATPREVRQRVLAEASRTALNVRDERSDEVRSDRYQEAVRRTRSVVADADGLVASAATRSLSDATARLVAAFRVSVPADFVLDNGAVYPVGGEAGFHRFRLDMPLADARVFDPFKLVRAAAFAGWMLTGVPTEDSLFEGLDVESLESVDE